ncbi:MAG: hypothetical protein COW00_02940 [Bdellovibrio sp. CG12_big_fil_rev_8_21_14_0_65_39_13]|nr:MAG: hypothetical protein COW78_13470 [Bdellovibrio sp. CG22_combo_CG10-13_8_21_14_all_39_27]PIQ61739.1 MAG: hypothetical protein COW00_02940 [Bdellovibrio sp. CG12_big_fil_rev_8_21_14_0_65_39_13]PIR34887.1 MAG: hypothetical protein COV37_11540 [Bdellovibrio sp. CG11_big_fil_rev_8_21_14_0_20_39_38]PJB54266.1 MAG: hypothetical protein CO099_02500 [Bdellovibrio sp. CG_4_9_14_3_um_filter_39_7]
MTCIRITELIELLNQNGISGMDDFSIVFVDKKEHQEKYEETRDFRIADGTTLNIDLDKNENVLSIEIIKFTK